MGATGEAGATCATGTHTKSVLSILGLVSLFSQVPLFSLTNTARDASKAPNRDLPPNNSWEGYAVPCLPMHPKLAHA